MSHVYSFAFVNLFVLTLLHFLESRRGKYVVLSGLLLGIITIIRPVNALIVLIFPFLAGDRQKFLQGLKGFFEKWKSLLGAAFSYFVCIFIQLVFYKLEAGEWIVYSYGEEKMHLLSPHLAGFLFSYKKGLFVYLPLIFISLAGLVFLYRKNRWQFYSVTAFLFLVCYILSSWWNWWYGGSFGMRSMIEYFFLFAILLGIAIESLAPPLKKIFLSLCFLCLIICQVQTYQYRYYFIHWDSMNKEKVLESVYAPRSCDQETKPERRPALINCRL